MNKQTIWRWIVTIVVLAAAGVLFLYPIDYYVKKPGDAYDAKEYIDVEDKDRDDIGKFQFTTVSVMKATPFLYAMATVLPNQEVVQRSEMLQEEEDENEYKVRQLKLMDHSKFNALRVAFEQADLPYTVRFDGVQVLNVLKDSAADDVLVPGDMIVEINGELIESIEKLGESLEGKSEGDKVELVIQQNQELVTKEITLKEIPNTDGKIGLGVTYSEQKKIQTDPHVDMNTEDIGGPSAGLMFTLEILNQLLDEDLTKGYIVAGTGTINENGTVGRIGGIDKKVIAADKAGASYFLAPDDELPAEALARNPHIKTNYEEALEAIKKIDTTMEVVPVKTIDDAMVFLNNLPPKD